MDTIDEYEMTEVDVFIELNQNNFEMNSYIATHGAAWLFGFRFS
jgi:hypothetical protein